MNGETGKSSYMDALVKELAQFSGSVNQMSTEELIEKLKSYGLDTDGGNNVRRRRLIDNYRKSKLASLSLGKSQELLPHYVVIDFEATCVSERSPAFLNEIIEFPAVLINSSTQSIEDTFQVYCKPVINPKLTDYCTDLTGITQEQVDAADTFDIVLNKFNMWLSKHKLGKKRKFAIVTDGPWDMVRFLFSQCQYSDVPYPKWARTWVNLKRLCSHFYEIPFSPIKIMLNYLDMEFEGRPHSGLDDAKNLSRILLQMILDGASICPNEMITTKPPPIWRGATRQRNGNEPLRGMRTKEERKDAEKEEENKSSREGKRERAYFNVIVHADTIPTYTEVVRKRKIREANISRKLEKRLSKLELNTDVQREET